MGFCDRISAVNVFQISACEVDKISAQKLPSYVIWQLSTTFLDSISIEPKSFSEFDSIRNFLAGQQLKFRKQEILCKINPFCSSSSLHEQTNERNFLRARSIVLPTCPLVKTDTILDDNYATNWDNIALTFEENFCYDYTCSFQLVFNSQLRVFSLSLSFFLYET